MATITISREMGSLGDQLGEAVARKLGYRFLSRELIAEAAWLADVDESKIRTLDEQAKPGMVKSVMQRFQLRKPDGGGVCRYQTGSNDPQCTVLDEGSLTALMQDIIHDIYNQGNAVIMGRGAQMVLRGRPDTIHIRVRAPWEYRLARCQQMSSWDRARCEVFIRENDTRRANYLRSFYGVDWQDPALYDLVINTERLTAEAAAEGVVSMVFTLAGVQPAYSG